MFVGRKGKRKETENGVARREESRRLMERERKTAFLPRVLGNPEVSLCAIG